AIKLRLVAFIDQKGQFIWNALQRAIAASDIEFYSNLNVDLRTKLMVHLEKTFATAEKWLATVHETHRVPRCYATILKQDYQVLVAKLAAEIEIFCSIHEA